jgi:hypothetical protein
MAAHELDRLLGHIVDNDKIDFTNIKTFLTNGGRDEDIEFSFLELLDRLNDQYKIEHAEKKGRMVVCGYARIVQVKVDIPSSAPFD